MFALSLMQPWATLLATGPKHIDTRSWRTAYRGIVAIHASKGFPAWAREYSKETPFVTALERVGHHTGNLPLGCVIGVGNLHDVGRIGRVGATREVRVERMELPVTDHEIVFGDYEAGRWAWRFTNVHPLAVPIPCTGALGLWTLPPDIAEQITRVYP